MTDVGKALFGGSRFIFWTLTPAILVFLIAMPFMVPTWNAGVVAMLVAFWVIGVCLIIGMLNPARFHWVFRIVSGMVFAAYVAYLVSEIAEHGWEFNIPRSQGEANPINALSGLIIIGGPALIYTVLGRFTFRAAQEIDNENA